MKKKGKPALDIIEEAFMLLRNLPLQLWVRYYLGTLPFVAGLLFFVQFMSQSTVAYRYAVWGAFLTAFGFIWMKLWHSCFANGLLAFKTQAMVKPLSVRQWLAIARDHAANQWWCLVLFVMAMVLAVPFAWVNAYCQNFTILTGMEGVKHPKREAFELALALQKQNHALNILLYFFSFFVFLNILAGSFLIPKLVKMFLGMDTVFSIAGTNLFSTSFVFICASVTFLLVDPLVKTCYLLRVFYQRAWQTGEDLMAQTRVLATQRSKVRQVATTLAVLCFFCLPVEVNAQASDANNPSVSSEALAVEIEKTLSKPDFSWRMPQGGPQGEGNVIDQFFGEIAESISSGSRGFGEMIDQIWQWIYRRLSQDGSVRSEPGRTGISANSALALALVVVLCFLLFLFYRWIRAPKSVTAEAVAAAEPVPDLTKETIVATDLPEDQWLSLASEYLAKGELRLALRAYFLALLVTMESGSLIKVTGSKSNMDYLRELQRKQHAYPDAFAPFAANVRLFERAWYGLYPVEAEEITRFQENRERIGNLVRP